MGIYCIAVVSCIKTITKHNMEPNNNNGDNKHMGIKYCVAILIMIKRRVDKRNKAHSGTWTHNLLLRRQAPYPIRLCVLQFRLLTCSSLFPSYQLLNAGFKDRMTLRSSFVDCLYIIITSNLDGCLTLFLLSFCLAKSIASSEGSSNASCGTSRYFRISVWSLVRCSRIDDHTTLEEKRYLLQSRILGDTDPVVKREENKIVTIQEYNTGLSKSSVFLFQWYEW